MSAAPLELAGIVVACGAAALALAVDDARVRSAAIVLALLAAPLLVLGNVWDEPRVVDLRDSPATLLVGLGIGVLALAALTVLLRRRVEWLALAAIVALPIRVPIEIGGDTANLLVPLYLVIGAGALVRIRRAPGATSDSGPPRALRLLLAAGLLVYAVQAAYSDDVSNAIETIGFFLVPFAILFVLLAELEWTRRLLGRALVAVGAVALACAAVAIVQFIVRDLFLNEELLDANQLHVYFRVNSIFFDPNIFARYLALAMIALAAYIAWERGRLRLLAATAGFAVCLVALGFSYSISGFAALLAGLGMIAILRWSWRGLAAAAGVGTVGLAALVLAGGTPTSDIEDTRSIDSGRENLLAGGLELFGNRPLYGYGSGSFGRAFYDEIEPGARTTVSHSEPVTVAAEQGVIGLAVYLGLLGAALATLLGRSPGRTAGRTAVAACFVAMLISSFGYTGFTTDPATWVLLAVGLALWPRLEAG